MKSFLTFFLAVATLHAESPVLGKVGEIEVRTDEIREALAGLEAGQQAASAKDPAAVGQYVRALLVQRLVLKQALEKKWDQEPAVIAKLVRARETALVDSFLEENSRPDPGYPGEAELAAAYEANKEKLLVPRSYHLAQIFIAVDKDRDTAAKTKLDGVLKQLKAKGADFAAIARTSSEEKTSASNDGKIGWLTEEQIQPGIREKLPKLTLNTVSEPIRLADGWHILKVLDIREPSTPVLDQVREHFVTQLRSESSRVKRQEFISELIKTHPLAINEIELNKLLGPPVE